MSLADEIFPDKRRPDLVQTEWAKGWAYASVGFAEVARFLTENKAKFHAGIDQVGLVMFFLQRHRVELALKELLVAHGVDLATIHSPHSLAVVWDACQRVVGVESKAWQYLDAAGTELLALLHEHDPGSYSYRYPVDRMGQPHKRPKFIDVVALDKYVNALVAAVDGYMASSDEAREYEAHMREEFEQEMRQEYGDE